MLEYSQGFWYRHHPKPSRVSWWALVDTCKWRIMVGVCFVGLLFYWVVGSFSTPTEVRVNSLPVVSPLTISDPWTRADGEVGAFTPATQTSAVGISSQGFPYSPVISSSAMDVIGSPEESTPGIGEKSSLFFEEPDFVCEYLAQPNAFRYCASIGETAFLRQQNNKSLSRPLSVNLLLSIFSAR